MVGSSQVGTFRFEVIQHRIHLLKMFLFSVACEPALKCQHLVDLEHQTVDLQHYQELTVQNNEVIPALREAVSCVQRR